MTLRHFGEDAAADVRWQTGPRVTLHLKTGSQEAELLTAATERETKLQVTAEVAGKIVATREVTLKPVKKLTVYITPHSHTDIGYTEIQTAIERRQVQNLIDGMAAARRTADYRRGHASFGTSRYCGRRRI
jgi:hypothetical protein